MQRDRTAGDSQPTFEIKMYRRDGSVRAIAKVSAEDYEHASSKRWYLGRDGYAYRNRSHVTERKGHVAMHREILGLEKGDGLEVDHINLDKLDNRRENLRVVSGRLEQLQNQPSRPGSLSRYRGVSWHRASQKWRARVQQNGKTNYLGYYHSEEEAAEAAAAFRREHMPFATN